ncbi:MAG: hypothetical protein NTY03_02625, partial [Candidatus Bathyarchaeota archaeon]|nr:hypothetical protein [Candidatus Bathyarchaeota archaeon]
LYAALAGSPTRHTCIAGSYRARYEGDNEFRVAENYTQGFFEGLGVLVRESLLSYTQKKARIIKFKKNLVN